MNLKGKKSDQIKTILTIVLGFLLVFLLTKSRVWLAVALSAGIVGLMSSYIAEKIEWCWMKLSWILSLIVPNILLSLVFYLFLTPLAILSRVGKKDPLSLRNDKSSLFKDREEDYDKASFEKPW